MKGKSIERSRLAFGHAGTMADREQIRAQTLAQLANDVDSLKEAKHAVRTDFRRQLERWRTEAVPEETPVAEIPSEMHEARVYRLTAVFALLCEVGLAAWVFSRLGVPWWLGALSAAGITFTLHGVLLHLFHNAERPKETVYRIKRFVSTPATIACALCSWRPGAGAAAGILLLAVAWNHVAPFAFGELVHVGVSEGMEPAPRQALSRNRRRRSGQLRLSERIGRQ